MKFITRSIIIVYLMIGSVASFGFSLPETMITLKTIGDDGRPIEGATVGVGFEQNTGWGTKKISFNGLSDANGTFTARNVSNGYITYGAHKNGYYDTYGIYKFTNYLGSNWEPWNPEINVLLREMIDPTPMYARNTQMTPLEIPTLGKDIGFDLIEFDWVSPYGKGKKADFIFKLDKNFVNSDNFECTLTLKFTNKFDGIQLYKEERTYGSAFKLPRFAPETGYQTQLILSKKRLPGKPIEDNSDENNNYIFRVRSEEKNGKLIRGMYGKIYGSIGMAVINSKTARIIFTYYLNPDYSHNLEFDYKRNLFHNLNEIEQAGIK